MVRGVQKVGRQLVDKFAYGSAAAQSVQMCYVVPIIII